MVRCRVISCDSDSEKKIPGVSFHSFPDDSGLCRKWIEATGRKDWTPTKYCKICSNHFLETFLIKKKKKTVLYPDAVPTTQIRAVKFGSSDESPISDALLLLQNKKKTIKVPNVMANFMEYHVMGRVGHIRLNPGSVPSKFECQPRMKKKKILPASGDKEKPKEEIECPIIDPQYCMVFGCRNSKRQLYNLASFPLPKDIDRRREWLHMIGREDLLQNEDFKFKSYVVCENHFETAAIKIVKHLHPEAVPTKNLPHKSQNTEAGAPERMKPSEKPVENLNHISTDDKPAISFKTKAGFIILESISAKPITNDSDPNIDNKAISHTDNINTELDEDLVPKSPKRKKLKQSLTEITSNKHKDTDLEMAGDNDSLSNTTASENNNKSPITIKYEPNFDEYSTDITDTKDDNLRLINVPHQEHETELSNIKSEMSIEMVSIKSEPLLEESTAPSISDTSATDTEKHNILNYPHKLDNNPSNINIKTEHNSEYCSSDTHKTDLSTNTQNRIGIAAENPLQDGHDISFPTEVNRKTEMEQNSTHSND